MFLCCISAESGALFSLKWSDSISERTRTVMDLSSIHSVVFFQIKMRAETCLCDLVDSSSLGHLLCNNVALRAGMCALKENIFFIHLFLKIPMRFWSYFGKPNFCKEIFLIWLFLFTLNLHALNTNASSDILPLGYCHFDGPNCISCCNYDSRWWRLTYLGKKIDSCRLVLKRA